MEPVHRSVDRPGSLTACRLNWLGSLAQWIRRCTALSPNACSASITNTTQTALTTVVPGICTSNGLINGQEYTRYYEGAGNQADGTGETLAGDFMAHAQGAIAPAWQVATVLAHWLDNRVNEGLTAVNAQACEARSAAEIKASNQALAQQIWTQAAIDFVANDGAWRMAV